MEPTTCCGGMELAMTPPGSTRSSCKPENSPAPVWKYHQGMPFCVLTTVVSAEIKGATRGASCVRPCALTPRKMTSTGPASARSPMILGRSTKSPSGLITRTPRSCMARRCGPRAKSVTSSPARVMRAPM